jgi:two-component system CheB/CheR fusion protein
VREGDGYRVQKVLRERVMFAVHNVLRDPPVSRLDLVVCRNLLIYFNRDIQRRALAAFHFALRRGGFLFLGSSESVDDADGFASVDKAHRIYRTDRPTRPPPVLAPVIADAPRHSAPHAVMELPARRRRAGLASLHQALLERYGPPSVVVNDQYDIVHVSDSAGRFLRFAPGEPSLNLLKTVDPALRLDLRAALYQAMESAATTYARVLVPGAEPPRQVSITVHAVRERDTGQMFALVLFDEQADEGGEPERAAQGEETRPLLEQLEAELAGTREQLRTTVEQYETQNEELKAGNEELQAINEELRSATEELETSKEELQSINEELTTVNQELKNKIDETTSINNDLQNFIASTEIAVLFVDRSLRLMRFTPPAREIFNVIGNDVGRPLLDLTHRLDYPELESDLQQVFESLRVAEREVRSTAGRWYIARTLPYRTLDDRIEGAVMTLIDITARKQTEERLRRSEEWMRFVVESVKDYAIFTMDRDGRVNTWNAGAQRLFGFAPDDIIGRSAELIFTPEDRAAGAAQEEMREARTEGRALDERWHMRKDGTRFYCSGIMAPLVDAELYGYVKIARDLTEQRLAAEQRDRALAEEQERQALREEAIEQKDEFLAVLSHELRNPLNLILMQAQVLLRSGRLDDPKVAHGAALIQQTAATSARMVEDLLEGSRIMTGMLALRQMVVRLSFLVGVSVGGVSKLA